MSATATRATRSGNHRGWRGRLMWVGAALLSIVALSLGAVFAASHLLGRTPIELIDHAKRRLKGHDKLEAVSLPVLEFVRRSLAGPEEVEVALPFVVAPLPPNPRRAASAPMTANAKILRVGIGRPFTSIREAARASVDGSVIEIDPGDYVADVAVWERNDLTIRGLGDRVRLVAAGADAEGKALWVFRSASATVENIEFVNARAADGNGAGIRLERGQLVVRRCRFWGSQNGILTSGDPKARLVVEFSEFGYNGAGDGQTHGLYVGEIESLRLTGSYFHHGNVGHLVKSRARHNRIEYNRLSDESGGRSSYELEFPNGGVAEVVGNVVQQGAGSRNSTMISYGAEGYRWPRNELALVHNTVVNDQRLGGTFVRVWPGAGAVTLRNNLFVGPGKVDASQGADAAGDREADWRDLLRPAREDYRLNDTTRARWASGTPASVLPGLLPRFEYQHPVGVKALVVPPLYPGALQSAP